MLFTLFLALFFHVAAALPLSTLSFSGGHLQLAPDSCSRFHNVVSGDICYSIAPLYSLTVDSLKALNPYLDCDYLYIGAPLCVANGDDPLPGCTNKYSVLGNDTCYDIAATHGIQLAKLYQLNPGLKCSDLVVNQQICLRYKNQDVSETVQVGVISASTVDGSTPVNATVDANLIASTLSSDDVLSTHNAQRLALNLKELSYSPSLASASLNQAKSIAANGCKNSDFNINGLVGENIFASSTDKPSQDVLSMWTNPENNDPNSALHTEFAVIVNEKTQLVGCARVQTNDHSCFVTLCEYYPPVGFQGLSALNA